MIHGEDTAQALADSVARFVRERRNLCERR